MPTKDLIQHRRGPTEQWAASTELPQDGQFVYNTTTGELKIGDGESSFDELPDVRKQFQNVVTVAKDGKKGSANFICSDYDSDDECIQAAIDYAAANNISSVYIGPGDYAPLAQIVISTSLKFICSINTKFTWIVNNLDMIRCAGSIISTILATSDVPKNSITVTLEDVSDVSPGDLILIYDDTIWNPVDALYETWKTGEMHEVTNVDTENKIITFYDCTINAYTVSNNLSVRLIHPISVEISRLSITGVDETAQHDFIHLAYCKNSHVYDCILDKGSEHGIYFYNSYNCSVYNNRITRCENTGNGYGVSINDASAHILVHDNYISQCRHCVASGGDYTIGQARDIRVYGNELYATIAHAIDAHQCVESIYAYNNVIRGNNSNEFAISTGSKLTKFTDNILYDCLGCTIRGSITDSVYIIENNMCYNSGYLFYDNNCCTNTEKLVSVSNNHMVDSYAYILMVTKAENLLISNNYIDGTENFYAIYIENATSGIISDNYISNIYRSGITILNSTNLDIYDNSLCNCCQFNANGELYEAAIALRGSTSDSRIINNRIVDTSGKTRYCIKEYSTANNNTITDNAVSGAILSQISVLGADTDVHTNNGYATENTGAATIPASGTSIIVDHGLVAAPTKYFAFPSANIGDCWIDTVTSTQMTIHCETAPASDITVSWSAEV